jgi:GNAT superfamily N-acetyltransferase
MAQLDIPHAVGSVKPKSFRDYTLLPVYRRTTEALRNQAIGFWLRHRVLQGACVADRRSHELVYVALAPDGEIAGLTSVSLGRRGQDGRNVYDFRIFVDPAHRASSLARELTNRSRDLLQVDSRTWPAAGMRLFAEDPKLRRPGIRRYLERHGYHYRGQNRHGQDQWFAPFPIST